MSPRGNFVCLMVPCAVLLLMHVYTSTVNAEQVDDKTQTVNKQCLACMCHGISQCNVNSTCSGDVCGAFKITWAFWADAGKPTVQGEPAESETAFRNCALDVFCSAYAIQGYMSRHGKDCNGDQKVDCDDYMLIHRFGGYGCVGATLPEDEVKQRYYQCKQYVDSVQDVPPPKH